MKLSIAITILILCLIKWRSKIVLLLTLIGLWFLTVNCGETLDSQNYINEYDVISITNMVKEPLYVWFVYSFQSMGFTYETYHAIASAIALCIMAISTYRLAKNYNLVLGIFLLYPFALYVVQVRNFYAFALSTIGLYFLNESNENREKENQTKRLYNEILSSIIIICAGLIHSAYLFFLCFIFAERLNVKKVIIITVVLIVVESMSINTSFLIYFSSYFNVSKRLEHAIDFQSIDGQSDITFRIIVTFFMCLCCFLYLLYQVKRKEGSDDKALTQIYHQNLFMLKINILCLIIIPFVSLIREVFRIQEALMLLNYIVLTNNIDNRISWRNTISWKNESEKNCVIIAMLLAIALIDAYLYIYRFRQLREFVIQPVFG